MTCPQIVGRLERMCFNFGRNWLHNVAALASVEGVILPPSFPAARVDVRCLMEAAYARQTAADLDACRSSSHCPVFGDMASHTLRVSLDTRLTFAEQRLSLQIALHNVRFPRIIWGGRKLKLDPNRPCTYCGAAAESLQHVLLCCQSLAHLRKSAGGVTDTLLLADHINGCEHLRRLTLFLKLAWPLLIERTPLV